MKLYFVRHGQSEYNKKGWLTGHTDSPLTEEGIDQARQTIQQLPKDMSIIYSSDLMRCIKTAEILNTDTNVPIIYDSRLRERSLGTLEGESWDAIDAEMRELDKKQQYDYRSYGGEHSQDVKDRILIAIDDIRAKHPSDTVVIVTSGGVIRMLQNVFNQDTQALIHNSSVHEFEFSDN